ncbi:MAG: flagellar type III secretion system pore protein FliP [Chloroflexi bacterium]|nr:flagellar type III secretion system pore protein FliP [Chloroflexota bacterium]MBI5715792.1 flagellar type III secretion system pore protein FliP [Chloroflexota bacterium]
MKKFLSILFFSLLLTACAPNSSEITAPGVTLSVQSNGQPSQVSTGVQLMVLLTVLSLAPAILILATAFTRIVIVLSMLRSAIGTQQVPPTQVIIGLSLVLTFFIMSPVWDQVNREAVQPYLEGKVTQQTAFDVGQKPVREFMLRQTRAKDIALFVQLSKQPQPKTPNDIPTATLLPAFVISELKTAFQMAFVIFVPFLVIDLIVSSALLSMGMMMLPPSLVSLPFKILLFVMADGWYLIVKSLITSFH